LQFLCRAKRIGTLKIDASDNRQSRWNAKFCQIRLSAALDFFIRSLYCVSNYFDQRIVPVSGIAQFKSLYKYLMGSEKWRASKEHKKTASYFYELYINKINRNANKEKRLRPIGFDLKFYIESNKTRKANSATN